MLKRHAVTTLLHAELANWCTICADASNERLCGNAPGGEMVGRVSKMRGGKPGELTIRADRAGRSAATSKMLASQPEGWAGLIIEPAATLISWP